MTFVDVLAHQMRLSPQLKAASCGELNPKRLGFKNQGLATSCFYSGIHRTAVQKKSLNASDSLHLVNVRDRNIFL